MASSSSGRVPQGEVVIEFGDGGTYVKHRLEAAVLDIEKRRIQKEEARKAREAMEALEVSQNGVSIKQEDVGFIIAQFGCKSDVAERALKESKGDLNKALINLIRPASSRQI